MRIEIRKKNGKEAILISFDTVRERFESASERNRFYWELHGRRQVVIKKRKRYVYQRKGVLGKTPHIKVSNSVFIVARENRKRMMDFFDKWEEKIELKTFPVILDKKEMKEVEE